VSGTDEKIAAANVSVASDCFLFALKLASGLMMGSIGMVSEAFNSGTDIIAASMARYSVKRSSEPADKDHRYGHGKYENLSGLVEGAFIFVVAAAILYKAATKFLDPTAIDFVEVGLMVMGVSAVLNYFVAKKMFKVVKKTGSLALEADAYNHLSDVWISAGVFVAFVAIRVTGEGVIDPMIAAVVGAFIAKAALSVTKRSMEGLVDKSLPQSEIDAIERVMKEHELDFVDFHKLRARSTGSERQIDLHLTVPRHLSVKEGHDLVEHLELEIRKVLPGSVIVIHIEPCNSECEKCRMQAVDRAFIRTEEKPPGAG